MLVGSLSFVVNNMESENISITQMSVLFDFVELGMKRDVTRKGIVFHEDEHQWHIALHRC